MPNEINIRGEAGGDGVAAQAAADKAAADAAAAAAAGNGAGGGEETVTMKKSDLKKIEDDRDNYKKGLLARKAEERPLENAGGHDAGAGASNVIDEKKVGEIVVTAINKTFRDASDISAKRVFLAAHPEYVDDTQWTGLMSNLTFKGGEKTHEDVLNRMDAALFEHKRSIGKLEEHLRAEHDRGVREGRIQGEVGAGRGTGDAGDRNDGGKGTGSLSPKGEEMARAMHTDPEKVKKVNLSTDNIINVM
jgi:hypothetical protein